MKPLPCSTCGAPVASYTNPTDGMPSVQRGMMQTFAAVAGTSVSTILGALDDGAQLAKLFGIQCATCAPAAPDATAPHALELVK